MRQPVLFMLFVPFWLLKLSKEYVVEPLRRPCGVRVFVNISRPEARRLSIVGL